MELTNKIFAVSGAGSGLGKATTRMLCDKGAKVIALDIKMEQDTLKELENDKVFFEQCDVSLPDQVERGLESGVSYFGGLHGAVACAGIAPAAKIYSSRHGSHSSDQFVRTVAINLGGTFNLFNASVPHIKNDTPHEIEGEKGVLIATSSVAAYEGQVGQVAYAASKGGVSSMILPLARELARSGIRVNGIAPGIFKTPMVDSFPEEVQMALAEDIPFPHRLGHPEEFASLVLHIITNTYINGTVLRLDGGVRMK